MSPVEIEDSASRIEAFSLLAGLGVNSALRHKQNYIRKMSEGPVVDHVKNLREILGG